MMAQRQPCEHTSNLTTGDQMSSFPWASQMVPITSRSGWSTRVYEPLIRHRWNFYSREPAQALAKLQQLPPNTIQAILEHLYANAPVARANLSAFNARRIVDSIPGITGT